jgi:hypothetical protein
MLGWRGSITNTSWSETPCIEETRQYIVLYTIGREKKLLRARGAVATTSYLHQDLARHSKKGKSSKKAIKSIRPDTHDKKTGERSSQC